MGSSKSIYGIGKHSGPFATVYACPRCSFFIKVPKSHPANRVGRGYGLRTGGAAFSQMAAHVRREHPDQPRGE